MENQPLSLSFICFKTLSEFYEKEIIEDIKILITSFYLTKVLNDYYSLLLKIIELHKKLSEKK